MNLYLKNKEAVLLDSENRFIYEVFVFVHFPGQTSMANHKYFISNKEIKGIIPSFYINKNIEIVCELYAAPKNWLIENEYTLYTKKWIELTH